VVSVVEHTPATGCPAIIARETLMFKLKVFFLIMVAAVASVACAQTPADGHVSGHAYVNSYFHISYTWPAMLTPAPAAAPDHGMTNNYQTLLFSARQGNQPYGVVMVAEKLNVAGPHSPGIKSSADMIDRLAQSLRPGPVLSNINRSQKKNAHGMTFDALNYTINGKPSAVIATQVGQYILVFKCSAESAAGMAQMEKAALEMRVGK
jgi:hypothetical protein